jgi:transcriptional regulator with XRE-family HTH domain
MSILFDIALFITYTLQRSTLLAHQSKTSNLGQRVAAYRSQLGLTQTAVAERAGLAPSYLSRIENEKIYPTVPTAQKIAAALRVPLSELLEPTPAQRRKQSCPITAKGMCLIDLIDPKWTSGSEGRGERYTPRQIRLMRQFTALVREGSPELLKSLEVVVGGLLEPDKPKRKRHR